MRKLGHYISRVSTLGLFIPPTPEREQMWDKCEVLGHLKLRYPVAGVAVWFCLDTFVWGWGKFEDLGVC